MVSIFDRIIRGVSGILGQLGIRQTGDEEIEGFEGFGGRESLVEPADRALSGSEFRRKFVSGLFYCKGTKRQFFAVTFEANDADRSDDLLGELDNIASDCSEIRNNFGYSDDEVPRSDVRQNAIYPDMESGEL